MHRVLTFQVNQTENDASESISKRMCCSLIFTAAFLSLVAGFLLGRYATERAYFIKESQVNISEEQRAELINKLSNAAQSFTILTSKLKPYVLPQQSPYIDTLLSMLECKNFTLPDINVFKTNVPVHTNNILMLHLKMLTGCLNNASIYIEQEIFLGYDNLQN